MKIYITERQNTDLELDLFVKFLMIEQQACHGKGMQVNTNPKEYYLWCAQQPSCGILVLTH